MKKSTYINLFAIIIGFLSVLSCKKDDAVKPAISLSNTTWTGYFTYGPFRKEGDKFTKARLPFGMQFLDGGKFKFYEIFGISVGDWKIENDTIMIEQENSNIIKLKYAQGKLAFISMQGAPEAWEAFDLEKNVSDINKDFEGSLWYNNNVFCLKIINVEPFPKIDYSSLGLNNISVNKMQNMLWWQTGTYLFFGVIRSNTEMSFIRTISGTNRFEEYKLIKKVQ